MLRWYTGRVTYESHKINPEFDWQRIFHDRIIRDDEEYKIKTRYIQKNPLKWKEDEFYGHLAMKKLQECSCLKPRLRDAINRVYTTTFFYSRRDKSHLYNHHADLLLGSQSNV